MAPHYATFINIFTLYMQKKVFRSFRP